MSYDYWKTTPPCNGEPEGWESFFEDPQNQAWAMENALEHLQNLHNWRDDWRDFVTDKEIQDRYEYELQRLFED